MTIRFCGACGTEIDETAAFCPSCGRPLDDDRPAMKPPPTWDAADETRAGQQTAAWTSPGREPPTDEPAAARRSQARPDGPEPEPEPQPEPEREREPEPETQRRADDPPRAREEADAHAPQPREPAPTDRPSGAGRSRPSLPSIDIPVTWPVTLSGWLIGIGAVVGVLALFLPWTIAPAAGFFDRWGLTSPVNLLLLAALLAIAVSVFFSAHVPDFAYRRLAILAVVLIGLGVGLDRLGIGAVGSGAVLFFLAMLAATIGALLVEVGADRPLSGPGT